MTELILSGGWFSKEGLYKAHVEKIEFHSELNDINCQGRDVFLLISYDLSSYLINVPIKNSHFPHIICCHLKGLERLDYTMADFSIRYQGQAIQDMAYKEKVIIIKDYISRGIIYQVNLTNRFDFTFNGSVKSLAFGFYTRQVVPYFFCLAVDDLVVISGSMELFLSKDGQRIFSKPIKGTAMEQDFLRKSEKDKAENLMITDMVRNDLGRVSDIGSVKTTELFSVTKYQTLYQMHSTVEGITKMSFKEIIRETFPPASVTGAPKIKAVEIIDQIEPHSRGYYCGCGGLLRADGDFIMSVLIRTAFGRGGFLSYFAGCGIVYDSNPDRELEEMYLKVRAFYDLKAQ